MIMCECWWEAVNMNVFACFFSSPSLFVYPQFVGEVPCYPPVIAEIIPQIKVIMDHNQSFRHKCM